MANRSDDVGIIQDTIGNGLFGSLMTWVLEILPYLKEHALYPSWDLDASLYGKIIPNLILAKRIIPTSNRIETLTNLKKAHAFQYTHRDYKMAHTLFFEYFTFSAEIEERVRTFQTLFQGKTLGIHFRGTDKLNSEAEYISIEVVIKNISQFLSLHPNTYASIFVITDEDSFLTNMINEFKHQYTMLYTNARKSKTGEPLHVHNCTNESAKEALVDSLLLSKCDYVIKTSSCLSDWVKIWNPDIEVYNLNRFYFNWFPQAYIPIKSYVTI
jgi:hypothetical protein